MCARTSFPRHSNYRLFRSPASKVWQSCPVAIFNSPLTLSLPAPNNPAGSEVA